MLIAATLLLQRYNTHLYDRFTDHHRHTHTQERMQRIRIANEERAKQQEIEDEKARRKSGKTMVSAKNKFKEYEDRRIVEERKREKQEEKARRWVESVFCVCVCIE